MACSRILGERNNSEHAREKRNGLRQRAKGAQISKTRTIARARSFSVFTLGLGYVYTGPHRIGFCLQGTFWNRSRCLHGTVWIRSGPIPERSRVNSRPVGPDFRTGSIWTRLKPVPRKHNLRPFVLKAMLHEAIFLATCLATFVARQVARKIASCNTPCNGNKMLRCELQEK